MVGVLRRCGDGARKPSLSRVMEAFCVASEAMRVTAVGSYTSLVIKCIPGRPQ
jgi:hypothetical protein